MSNNIKVALVTGGASGMGRTAALRMAAEGAKVAILDMNEQALEETAAQAEGVHAYRCDVTDLEAVREIVAAVETDLGPVDRLMHCAAIMPGESLKEMSAEMINKIMLINYCGTVNLVKTVWPRMEQRGSGQIAVFGSMAGDVLTPNLGAYCASKSATNSLMEVLVRENKDGPVQFLLVYPPAVNTPLIDQAVDHGPASLSKMRADGGLVTPDFMIDAIEKAFAKGDWVVRPGQATFMYYFRRFFPKLLWRVIEKADAAARQQESAKVPN